MSGICGVSGQQSGAIWGGNLPYARGKHTRKPRKPRKAQVRG